MRNTIQLTGISIIIILTRISIWLTVRRRVLAGARLRSETGPAFADLPAPCSPIHNTPNGVDSRLTGVDSRLSGED
jgi:hypothetical protein